MYIAVCDCNMVKKMYTLSLNCISIKNNYRKYFLTTWLRESKCHGGPLRLFFWPVRMLILFISYVLLFQYQFFFETVIF